MKLLTTDTYEKAAEFNARAFAHAQQTSGARGSSWSDILTDNGTPARFGILFSSEIAGAFTPDELAAVVEGGPDWVVAIPPEVQP